MEKEPYQFRRQRDKKPDSIDEATLQEIDADARRTITPTQSAKTPQKHPLNRKTIVGAIVVLLIALLVGVGFYVGRTTVHPDKNISTKVTSKAAKEAIIQEKTDTSDLGKFITPTTGEKWHNSPKQLPSQGYVAASYVESVNYFEVGTRGKNTIILGSLNYGIGSDVELFEKDQAGNVRHIAQPSSTVDYSSEQVSTGAEALFIPSVTEDTATHYDSLSIPKSLAIDGGDSIQQPSYPTLGQLQQDIVSEGTTTRKVKQYGSSTVVRTERKYVDTGLTSIGYAINLPIGTQVDMTYQPIPEKLTAYTWDNEVASDDTVGGIVRGCGARGSVSRADTVASESFTPIGKTPDGQTIYGFKNKDATLVTKAYEEYVQYNQYDPSFQAVSKEEFIKQHGIFAYKSYLGEWLIYTSDKFSPATGCAKPVVYLYPETPTQVAVRVGADVKISDPLYSPSSGWSVYAQPDGRLNHQGTQYASLFWEGPGWGEYPSITTGVVVAKDKAITTIKKQLTAQGLNAQESKDFLDYWQNKIPNKPYIRLTWLTNAQINALAPLSVSPKPDTVHRVFLDMAGLDQPVKLTPQKLETVTRKGFTVIEWGGLAQGKLY